MALEVSLDQLLKGQAVESSRIEYKENGGVLEPIIHTICAFANDIENVDGGYIIIGISAKDGVPVLSEKGLDVHQIEALQKKIFGLCHKIQPFVCPEFAPEEYQGKHLLVLRVHAGYGRPYRAAKHISDNPKKNEDGEYLYYVRHGSNTVVAQDNELRALYEVSSRIPFDDQPNPSASLEDLSRDRLLNHLQRTGSELYSLSAGLSTIEIARRLNLLGGSPEHPMLKNVAILMFSDKVNVYFPEAYINVVDMPDPTGEGMQERNFKGPIQDSLEQALLFIKNSWITTQFNKPVEEAKSLHVTNYPLKAIQELLANAVYHRDYTIPEPITIRKTPDFIEIKSFPGLSYSFTDEQIQNLELQSDFPYRNRRIGNFLKELGLTEGHNTGIPLARKALLENGSEPMVYILTKDRASTIVRIPVQPLFQQGEAKQRLVPTKKRTPEEISANVLLELSFGPLSLRRLAERLGYNSPSKALQQAVNRLIAEGKVVREGKGRSSLLRKTED